MASLVEVAKGELGVTESPPGSNEGPRVSEYLAGCERRGVGRLHLHAAEWCAAFVGWCANQASLAIPWRASVAEVVTDAWSEGFRPVPTARAGDLAVWRRLGEDPRKGGHGHIGIVEFPPDNEGFFRTIEGNHNNHVAAVDHSIHEPDFVGFLPSERS